jgi:hypothetical protein
VAIRRPRPQPSIHRRGPAVCLRNLHPVGFRLDTRIIEGVTNGAASIWVGDCDGLARLGAKAAVKLVDWEVGAMDFRVDGMSMAGVDFDMGSFPLDRINPHGG